MLEMVDLVEVVVINLPVVGMEYLVKEVLGVTQLGLQLLRRQSRGLALLPERHRYCHLLSSSYSE